MSDSSPVVHLSDNFVKLTKPPPVVKWLTLVDQHTKQRSKSHKYPLINLKFGEPIGVSKVYTDIVQKTVKDSINEHDFYKYRNQNDYIKQREYIVNELNSSGLVPMYKVKEYKWQVSNVLMTRGCTSSLFLSCSILLQPNEHMIIFKPFWPYYDLFAQYNQCKVSEIVLKHTNNFSIDFQLLEKTINPNTRIILLNIPNNPIGKIYNKQEMIKLSKLLEKKSLEYNKRIFIVTDEVYKDYIYDNKQFISPSIYYPFTIVNFSYAKRFLAPQERIGYVAFPNSMPSEISNKMVTLFTKVQKISGGLSDIIITRSLIRLNESIKVRLSEYQIKRDYLFRFFNDFMVKRGYIIPECPPDGAFYFVYKPPYGKFDRKFGVINDFEYCKLFMELFNVVLLPCDILFYDMWVRITFINGINKIKECCKRLLLFDDYLMKFDGKMSKL